MLVLVGEFCIKDDRCFDVILLHISLVDLLRYSLLESSFSRLFRIDERTGSISTNALFDRELQSSALVTVKAAYAGLDAFAQVRI